jgi:hypothetical protein
MAPPDPFGDAGRIAVIGASGAASVVALPIVGNLLDRRSERLIVGVGAGIMAAGIVLAAFAPSLGAILGSLLQHGPAGRQKIRCHRHENEGLVPQENAGAEQSVGIDSVAIYDLDRLCSVLSHHRPRVGKSGQILDHHHDQWYSPSIRKSVRTPCRNEQSVSLPDRILSTFTAD